MYQLEQGHELPVDLGGDLVHHSTCMLVGMEPLVPGHLLLCEIGTSHGRDGGPCAFGETVRGLPFGRSTVDLRVVAVDPTTGFTPQEFLVAVAAEFFGETAGVGSKLLEGADHVRRQQVLETVYPDVFSGTVDEEEGEAESKLAEGVAGDNVHVDLVQVALGGREGHAAVAFLQVCKFAEGGSGFATLNELGVLGDASKVLVVTEATVAEEVVGLETTRGRRSCPRIVGS